MPATESRHKVRDVSVRMLRGGSGPPVVFLHGANGLPQWLPFFELLAKECDVRVPEHPGYGTSDNPAWMRNIGDLAMYYLDFLDGLGVDKVHLVGQSVGGWAAAEVAVRSCARLASLTLLAPAGLRVKGVPCGDNFIWGPEEALRNLYHDQSFADRILAVKPSDEQMDVMLKNRFTIAKFGWQPRWFNPDLEKWLHRIGLPALIVWGDDDKIMPREYADLWQQRLPAARLVRVKECGHL